MFTTITRPSALSALVRALHTASLADVRAVVRLDGPELRHFLQGLVTNDVNTWDGVHPLYAAILNPQGRYLHDLFLHPVPGASAVHADVDKNSLPTLLKLLRRWTYPFVCMELHTYRLRAQVDIDDVSDTMTTYVQYGQGSAQAEGWPQDPRLPCLGHRTVLEQQQQQVSSLAADAVGYRRWRMQQGVAEGDAEIPSGEAICLEYNYEALHGISFDKGCYVGQELMARTHFKGTVRKRLMPVELQGLPDGQTVPPGTDVLQDGKSVGKLRVHCGPHGLALLRVAAALPAAHGGPTLMLDGRTDVAVFPRRPSWWPDSWGAEGQGDSAAQL